MVNVQSTINTSTNERKLKPKLSSLVINYSNDQIIPSSRTSFEERLSSNLNNLNIEYNYTPPASPQASPPTSPSANSTDILEKQQKDLQRRLEYISHMTTLSPLNQPILTSKSSIKRSSSKKGKNKNLDPAISRWKSILGPVNWDGILKTLHSTSRTHLESEFYSKILYRKLPVNHYIRVTSPDHEITHNCQRCLEEQDETIEHFLCLCGNAQKFWTIIGNFISKILDIKVDEIFEDETKLRDVVYFFPKLRENFDFDEDQLTVLTVVHSTALWGLWGARSHKDPVKVSNVNIAWNYFESRLQARLSLFPSEFLNKFQF
ncbi:hypothetical protein HK099_002689 [Clydaea vesicula]|uniref:Reverse transcriptase zinc-binding domain-containing protein n=1 Tax=Clydaea vesicula TaxID=447962 RepID=A0AAD5U2Q7_9FUNG|nr:hypothetical protein HK099_002689 [Clydaea vesicula]KAJ3387910.1 hypothetical protein HDU92_001739 [Lobulomyces angularis]